MFLAYNFLLIGEKKNGFYELSLDEDAGIKRVQSSKKESKQNRRYIDCLYSVVMWFNYLDDVIGGKL